MRFLADQSCDFAVVRVLRQAGHDVRAVSEFQQRLVTGFETKLRGAFAVLRPGSVRLSMSPFKE